jgi:hypothetical protein
MLLPFHRRAILAFKFSWIAWMMMVLVGCSHSEDTLQQALDKAQQASNLQKGLSTSLTTDEPAVAVQGSAMAEVDPMRGEAVEAEVGQLAESTAANKTAPFPDRADPFEFAAGVDFDAPQNTENKDLEIKLFGFVGAENPKAIINVGGRTKVMAEGEKWGVLEVIAVSPPNVRVKSDGVIRVWSLLGKR